jgi:hypothetical protein
VSGYKDRLSKKGDPKILKILYMSSVSSVRNNSILKEKYLKMKANGKASKVALVSVMSQLLRAVVSRYAFHSKRTIKK